MAEPLPAILPPNEPRGAPRDDPEAAPLDSADFPGCEAVHIPPEEIGDYDGRLEYWEARTGIGMTLRETSTYHELPSQRLARLAERIAAARGTLIETYGSASLVRFDREGRQRVLMQADQIVYLYPPSAGDMGPRIDVDGDALPDVVLEVDYSTDVRVRKLPLYELWGFPEVWVDVPDEPWVHRPKSRSPGLTIHVLADGRFRQVECSPAFLGWTADEIHRALNEDAMSAETAAALHRVGANLGAADATGPDDDMWMRHYRDTSRADGRTKGRAEGREEGLAEGRTKGLAEGRAAMRAEMVAALLQERGILPRMTFPTSLEALGEFSEADLIRAALACSDEADFFRICTGIKRL